MNRFAWTALICGATACGKSDASPVVTPRTAVVSGTIRLAGAIDRGGHRPQLSEPPCQAHSDFDNEDWILGPGQTMGNVFISVTKGLEDRRFPPPERPAHLTQWCVCTRPRVLGLRVNQFLMIRNGEARLHNVNAAPRINPQFSRGQAGPEMSFRFASAEPAIPFTCDIHPWERSWVHVVDHPFFAVTGADGLYSLRELPPGEYEIAAWHEKFAAAPLVSKVKVAAGESATLDFTFEIPTTGSISGTSRLEGVLKPDDLANLKGMRCKTGPIDASKLRTVIVDDLGRLANVYVTVKSGPIARSGSTAPEANLDLAGCVYMPRISCLRTNQKLIARNSDEHHYIRLVGETVPQFGLPQVPKKPETFNFAQPEVGIALRCDLHPWMKGWIHVADHPHFALTGSDGSYSLSGLPPGDYEILAWHERFQGRPLTAAKVKVEAGKTTTLDFAFKAPPR